MSKYEQQWSVNGVVDWSVQPDATHYVPETDDFDEAFLLIDGGVVYFTNDRYHAGWQEDGFSCPEELENPPFIKK